MANKKIKLRQFRKEELEAVRHKLKAENLQVLTKYFRPNERQGNLTFFFDYVTLCINKTQKRNG